MKSEDVTAARPLSGRRWYDDACGTALALEFIGERWSLLVMRELFFGPRRFGEIKANLPGISANVLTQRLAGLEAGGIVARRRLPSPASVQVYELTQWGLEAEPIFQAMGRWATRSRRHDPTLFLSPASAMMSLRTMIDPARSAGEAMTIAFRFPHDAFVGRLSDGELAIARGESGAADATITGDTATLVFAIHGKVPFAVHEAAGTLAIAGDRAAAERFAALFALPDKID